MYFIVAPAGGDVPPEAPMIVIEFAPLLRVMFEPATRDAKDDEPLREKLVAAGTVGPTIVMDDAPVLRVTLAPATNDTLLEVAFNAKLVAAGTVGP